MQMNLKFLVGLGTDHILSSQWFGAHGIPHQAQSRRPEFARRGVEATLENDSLRISSEVVCRIFSRAAEHCVRAEGEY
jgi:hypothetical protein